MFTAEQVRPVLKHVGGAQDRAADWLFSHMDSLDADIAALAAGGNGGGGTNIPHQADIQVRGDGKGLYDLLGFVSHIGPNTGSGHYVAHVLKDGEWVIFNDDKVAKSVNPPLGKGYLYLFKRREGEVEGW